MLKKRSILKLILSCAFIIMMLGATAVSADDDPGNVPQPYVTADGSKLTIHANGNTLCGIKYMSTAEEFTYTTWANYVKVGKQDQTANTKSGYRTIKNFTDGYTFVVKETGYYNFVLTYNDSQAECFPSVQVTGLSSEPTVSGGIGKFTVSGNDFTVSSVKYIYTGNDVFTGTTWSSFVSKGKQNAAVNGSSGYKSAACTSNVTEIPVYNPGNYTVIVTYDLGEIYCNCGVTINASAPSITNNKSVVTLTYGGDGPADTVTSVQYMKTDDPFTYSTWSKFVSAGKKDTAANSASGYRTFPSTENGAKLFLNETGYYNFLITYNNGKTQEFCSLHIDSLTAIPSVAADGNTYHINNGDLNVTAVKYIFTGNTRFDCSSWNQMLTKGKEDTLNNSSKGYRTLSASKIVSASNTMNTSGWYTFLLTTELGEFFSTVQISSETLAPYVTAEGSKITLHTGSVSLTAADYIWSSTEYSYTTWAKFVSKGKENTDANSSKGYQVTSSSENGYTFEVKQTGWYSFLFTADDGQTEYFASVNVTSLSEEPSIVPDAGSYSINEGDFTVTAVKYIYTGDTAFNCTSWSQMSSKGLEDTVHNSTKGYLTVKNPAPETDYVVNVPGYYTFLITYDMGEVFRTVKITTDLSLPSASAEGAAIVLDAGGCTIDSCKYIYTGNSAYTYTTWSKFVSKGKKNAEVNGVNGYRNLSSPEDGQSIITSRTGYYTVLISYTAPNGNTGEEAVTVHVTVQAVLPTITASQNDSIVTVNHGGVTLSNVRYVFTGNEQTPYTTWAALSATGKNYPSENSTMGYRSVKGELNSPDGNVVVLEYAGWYTFVLTYGDGEVSYTVEITSEQANYNKPYIEINDMDVTIYANGSDLNEILYMYSYDPYTYSTWNSYIAKGKLNTYVNSSTGYRSIEATGDTSFTCFELGYYTFVLKYTDSLGNNRERYITISPVDIRKNVYLQPLGGYILSTDWELDTANPTMYTRKAIGTIALPTPSVPNNSETVQFAGWYTDLSYENKVTSITLTRESEDITLYAKWILTATNYEGTSMYYTVGQDNRATSMPLSNFTDVGGKNGSNKINMVANFWGFHDFYSYPGEIITENVNKAPGTANTYIPYTVGDSIFGEVANGVYMAKVCNISGNYVEVNYYLYNSNNVDITNFSIGCAADVNCNGDPSAIITENTDAGGKYLLMQSSTKDTAFRIYLNEADYWIGTYKRTISGETIWYFHNVFNTSSGNLNNSHWDKGYTRGNDSSMTYNWRNLNIPAGQFIVKSIKFGVGNLSTMGSNSGTIIGLNANGGTFEDSSSTKTISEKTVTKMLVSTFEEPTREGYTFSGWNTSSVGAGKNYSPSEYVSNTQLYALWTKNTATKTYKLYNHSYIRAGENAEKIGSAIGKITFNYAGGLIQQGTNALGAVSTENDFVATVSITDGYYLPNNINVKIGSKALIEGIGYLYELNEAKTQATLIIYKEYLTNNAHVYIYGTDRPVIKPVVSVEDQTVYVSEESPVPVTVNTEEGYTYTYQWYKVTDLMGSGRKALSSANAKTATLSFLSNSTGIFYYECLVTATRTVDGQQSETLSEVVAVHCAKKPLDAYVIVNEDGTVSVSSNPDKSKVIYTFYTDADLTERTSYENGATEVGGRPIKPLAEGNYYVQALILEGKKTLSCQTEAAIYDALPTLPFLTTEGYFATLHDNGTNVTSVKYMYSPSYYSYTTWSKFVKEGKNSKKINSNSGYRNISRKKDDQGVPVSMDGTVIEMSYAGCYTFLITTESGIEVSYSLIVTDSDLAYHKPYIIQPTTNGHQVIFYNNDSALKSVKYMYSSSEFTYSTWAKYTKQGKLNTTVNTAAGYRSISGSVDGLASTLDRFTITLPNLGYYTFVLTYENGAKEKYENIVVSNDYETNDNAGILLVDGGVITATTANNTDVLYIKFANAENYITGNTLKVNATGLYNVAIIDANGYTYYLVADVTKLDNTPDIVVDKTALLSRIGAANELLTSISDVESVEAADPGTHVLTSDKSAFASAISEATAVNNDTDVTQAQVDEAYTALGNAITAFKEAKFTVEPHFVTVDGSTINVQATSQSFTLKVVRYNVNTAGLITPTIWDNWNGFQSIRYKNITKFTDGRSCQFIEVPNGIYTFIIQQVETSRTGEYFDYAVVHNDSTEAEVIADTLSSRITAAADLLDNTQKESETEIGSLCMPDSKWSGLNSSKQKAEDFLSAYEAAPENYDLEKDIIPELMDISRAINQATSATAIKAEPVAPIEYDPISVVVGDDNTISISRDNLAYAYVAYGHYTTWNKLSKAGYVKVTAAAANDTKTALYDSAIYNGEYTILAHYKDGKEEFKYATITNIVYPFTVSSENGQITLTVDIDKTVTKAGYCFGSNVKTLTNEFYLFETTGANEYTWDSMGNGVHTVYVKIGSAQYFVDIEVTTATVPSVLRNADGGTAIFTNGLTVTGIDMASTAFTGKRSPATNTWLDLADGDYTFTVYMESGKKTINITID